MDIGATDPDALETRPCRTDVVIHLPARTEPVLLIAAADSLDHLPLHRITKIAQAIQGLQGAIHAAVVVGHLCGVCFERISRGLSVWRTRQPLLVPRHIGGWAGQAMARLGIERFDQTLDPARRDDDAAFQKDHHLCLVVRDEPVEARRGTACPLGRQLWQVVTLGQRSRSRRIRAVREEHQGMRGRSMRLDTLQRPLESGGFSVDPDAYGDVRVFRHRPIPCKLQELKMIL